MALLSIDRELDLCAVIERTLRTARTPESAVFRRRTALTDRLYTEQPPAGLAPPGIVELDGPGCTVAEFEEASENYAKPVVLRGFCRDSEAVRRWSPEHLRERVGDRMVTLFDQRDVEGSSGITQVKTCQRPFSAFLDGLGTERLYLNNSTELFLAFPELFEHLETDRIDARFGREAQATSLFIGSHKVFSPLHSAVNGNFFLNIAGRKRWRFVAPGHTHYLLPLFAQPFAYMVTPWTFETAPEGDRLWQLPHQEVVLEPGDGLYNAPWWWHEVRNEGDFVVGCAVRNRKRGWMRPFSSENWRNAPMLSAMSVLPLMESHYWAYKAKEAVFGVGESYAQTFNRLAESIVQRGLAASSEAEEEAS